MRLLGLLFTVVAGMLLATPISAQRGATGQLRRGGPRGFVGASDAIFAAQELVRARPAMGARPTPLACKGQHRSPRSRRWRQWPAWCGMD